MQVLKLFDDNNQLDLLQDLMEYTPGFIMVKEADALSVLLLKVVRWQQHKVMMYDKVILQCTPVSGVMKREREIPSGCHFRNFLNC